MTLEKKQIAIILYILFSLFEIIGELEQNNVLTFVFKPLLMPTLLTFYYFQTLNKEKSILLALFFSFLGDTFLLFTQQSEIYFLLGLGSFLVTQSAYVYTFYKDKKDGGFPSKYKAPVILFFLLGFGTLFYFIFPALGEFTIPVLVYASVVSLMGMLAVFRYNSVLLNNYLITLLGVFLFMISDTFIALDKFLYNGKLPYASALIMLLYIAGQYWIIKGRKKIR